MYITLKLVKSGAQHGSILWFSTHIFEFELYPPNILRDYEDLDSFLSEILKEST